MEIDVSAVLLHMEILEVEAGRKDVNEPDGYGRSMMDRALDLAGYDGDRLYDYIEYPDVVVQRIANLGGRTSDYLYQQELDNMMIWADHHYGCGCKLPWTPRYCK